MRRIVFSLALLFALQTSAFATWSVIAVDRSTGRVVIASSTCTGNTDDFLKDVQAVVVPGKGVAACQAGVDGTHQNQTLVFEELLKKETEPSRIIELLSEDPGYQGRQYGIVDLQGRMAGHSGLTNGFVTQDMHGQVPGTEIFYSIQGNILRPGAIAKAQKAFVAAKGGVTDHVMAAMEAADAAGGDSRCTCVPGQRGGGGGERSQPESESASPAPGSERRFPMHLPDFSRGLHSGCGSEAMPTVRSMPSNLHNNGRYASVRYGFSNRSQRRTHLPNIKKGENLNPVKTLRVRYDAWIKAHPEFKR